MVPAPTRFCRQRSMRMLPMAPVVWMALAIWGVLPSRIRLRMAPSTFITSQASTRPPPTLGRSCWLSTAFRDMDSCRRICCCRAAGNTSTMRSMESAAELVWTVPNTRWPVSAAVRAVSMVSRSRISPTRMTSGSSRRAARSPAAKDWVSLPTSRWLMTHLSGV